MAKKIQKYTLVGCDGNAFSIMGYVCRAFDESGRLFKRPTLITDANKKNYQTLAMSGNYDELLCISMQDRKSTRLNSSHIGRSRMPSSA